MARISAYPKHIPVQPEDYWIGTRASNLMTRNFTAKAVGEYINVSGSISMATCMLFKFKVTNAGPGDVTGVPNETLFSNIASLQINTLDVSDQDTVGFLEYIVGTEIIISEQNKISTFGHYSIDSYTQIEDTAFYTMNLTYIGGNGYIEHDMQYNICSFVLASEDTNTTYTLDSVQNGPDSDIRLIGSDETETDTGSNILIDVTGLGTVTSVGQTHAGNAFSVTGSPITTSGVLDITLNGDATQYIDGAGDLQSFPAIPVVPSNIVETLDTTDGTYIDLTPNAPTTGDVVVTADLSAIDGNAAAGERYLTKTNKWAEISTIPGTYEWEIQGDTGGPTVVNSTNIVTFVGGTNVSTALVGTTLTIDAADTNTTYDLTVPVATTDITLLGSDASSDSVTLTGGTNITVTRVSATELSIDGTDLNTTYNLEGVGSVDGTAGVRLAGSDASNDDVLIIGAGTTTVTRSLNTLTVTSNDQFQGTVTSVATTHAGNAFTANIGNVATINPSVDITMNGSSADYIDGAGNLQTFPTIPQGDITDVDGGTYITTVNSTGPVVTVNHDLTSRTDTASATTPSAGDTITAVDSVTTNTTGHVEAINLKSVTLPTGSLTSEVVDIQVKNISSANGGINLVKGDPVYIYGSVGASPRLYVDLADADSTAINNLGDNKMPCVGLLDQDLAPNGEGTATVVGKLRNLITSPIDGLPPNENDTVYVKSGGGLTLTKPAGFSNLIQNVGQVGRVSTSNDGNIVVAALLRSNDIPNLPTGRLFVGTATNTSLTSDVVYVDDTNDRVGIGTTSPDSKLEVASTDDITFLHIRNDSTGSTRLKMSNSTDTNSNGFQIINNGLNGQVNLLNYKATTLALWTNSLQRMTILSDGNVGIGTTAPPDKLSISGGTLSVSGSGSGFGVVKLGDPTSSTPYVGVYRSAAAAIATSGNFLNLGGYDGIAFTTGTAALSGQPERMRITENGRVGIGTTSPTFILDVANGLNYNDVFRINGANADVLFTGNTTAPTGGVGLWNFINTGTNATTRFYVQDANNSNDRLTFRFTGSNGSNEILAGTSSGNVGIGTTSPSELLHISSLGPARLLIEADTDNVTETDNAQIILKQDGGAVVGNLGYKTDTNGIEITNQYAAADGILTFGTSGIERMRVTHTGNVGIGTTSPNSKTHIFNSLVQNGLIVENPSSSFVDSAIYANNLATTNGNLLRLRSSGSDKMVVLGTGSVGIGTTSPLAKLHVANGTLRTWTPTTGTSAIFESTVSNRNFLTLTAANEAELWFGDASTQAKGRVRYEMFTNDMEFWTNATQKMVINTSGNVGIGTTSPTGAKLQVAVGNYSTGCRIDGPAGTTFGFMSFYSNGSYRGNIYPTSTGVIYGSASDYRLKENVIKLQNSTERVKKLKPSNFNFLENPGEIADGFIAHEIQEIVPEAVTGRKDEVGIDGKPIYQGVDYSKIVPLLTAALQEAILKIEQLETRIQTLENK